MPKANTGSRTVIPISTDVSADNLVRIVKLADGRMLADLIRTQGSSIRGLAEKVEKVSRALSFVLTVAFVGWVLGLIALAGLARFGGLI